KAEIRKTNSSIRERIEKEVDEIYSQAKQWRSHVWGEHIIGLPKGERGNYGLRVRRRKVGITIDWFWPVFFKDKNTGEWRVNYQFIGRGKAGYRYSMKKFPKAKPWEY